MSRYPRCSYLCLRVYNSICDNLKITRLFLDCPDLFQIRISVRMSPEIDLATLYRLFLKHPAHILPHNLMFLGCKADGSAPFCHFQNKRISAFHLSQLLAHIGIVLVLFFQINQDIAVNLHKIILDPFNQIIKICLLQTVHPLCSANLFSSLTISSFRSFYNPVCCFLQKFQ